MNEPTFPKRLREIAYRYNLTKQCEAELLALIKSAYITGCHSTWDLLTEKKSNKAKEVKK